MDSRGAYLILSNSDPKNNNPADNFFDELYRGYRIDRVPAKRNINSNTASRGEIKELIIRNFQE
jgi:DNA adenine methylase